MTLRSHKIKFRKRKNNNDQTMNGQSQSHHQQTLKLDGMTS